MPKPKGGNYKSSGGRGGKRQPPVRLGNPDADPVQIHRDYVERRLAGGREGTAEDYKRAYEQWSRLPGAVGAPPIMLDEDSDRASPQDGGGEDIREPGPDEDRQP